MNLAPIKSKIKEGYVKILVPFYAMRYPKYKGNETIVFHVGRCGSNLLSSMLNNHPQVDALGETNRLLRKKYFLANDTTEKKLKKIISRSSNKYTFFEIKGMDDLGIFDKNWDELRKAIEGLKMNTIILKRDFENILLSNLTAIDRKKRGLPGWVVKQSHDVETKTQKIRVDVNMPFGKKRASLEEEVTGWKNFYDQVEKNFPESIQLSYQKDLEQDAQIGLNKVLKHLGLSTIKATTKMVKVTKKLPEEVIENYKEVKEILDNCKIKQTPTK